MGAPNASNVIIPGKGAVFLADTGTTPPNYKTLSPLSPTTPWECLGHTSVENQIALSKDGGDATTFDSWWEAAIEVQRAATTWSVNVNALELSADTFDLAFNGTLENTSETGGYLVPSEIKAVTKAMFVLAVQGDKRMGLYFPNVSITLGDAPEFDAEKLFEIPLSASILSYNGNVMEWFHPSFDKAAGTGE